MRRTVFPGWKVVAGSAVGIGFSGQIFIASGYTLVSAALADAFGWSLADVAAGATMFLLGQIIGYPLTGVLLDRFGSRRVATAGIIAFALALLAASRIETLAQLQGIMFVGGIVGASTYTATYIRALSLWFVRRRGIAIGLAASGIALGAAVIPIGMQSIIASSGWSDALRALALVELLVCLPLVVWLVRDDPRALGLLPDGELGSEAGSAGPAPAATELPGLGFAEAVRTRDFWLMAFAYVTAALAVYAVITNTVHILGHTAGMSPEQVARVQALGGAAILLGRIGGGYALDHLSTRAVAIAMNLCIAAAILGYGIADEVWMVVVSALLIGFATGGEGDVLPYMTAKYLGTRAFGKIYGLLGALFALGTALGPVTYARLGALTGSASTPLLILAAITALSSLAFLGVGRDRAERPSSCFDSSESLMR